MLARERIVVAVMRTRNTGGDIVTAPATAVLASARMRGDVQPYLADADCVLYHGDALDVLRELPDESVHCIATSPPFYALRDYGTGHWEGGDTECEHKRRAEYGRAGQSFEDHGRTAGYDPGSNFANHKALDEGESYRDLCGRCGARRIDPQIGLEETPDAWAAALVAVFREARRVLRKDGTLWVEVGDSYASSPAKGGSGPNSKNSPTYGRASLALRDDAGNDTTDRARSDSLDCDCACHGLGDESGESGSPATSSRSPRSVQPVPESSSPVAKTGRDTERLDSPRATSAGSQPPFAPASTIAVGAPSPPLTSRAEAVASHEAPWTPARPSASDVPSCGCSSACNADTSPTQLSSADHTQDTGSVRAAYRSIPTASLKPKDLMGSPWLLAFALRADGWWLRGCNIWSKSNAMPESAKDRCTTAHSYVFQLSKSARYFFDGDAISEPATEDGIARESRSRLTAYDVPGQTPQRRGPSNGAWITNGRHPRSVWTIPTQGYPEAHFATWPEALARRIILAGCPESVCSVCGKARERIVDVSYDKAPGGGYGGRTMDAAPTERRSGPMGETALYRRSETLGFTDCACSVSSNESNESKYCPGTVLDPFVGSGTTCFVARKLGRRSIGIDLSAEYLDLAAKRLQQQSLFA